MPSAVATVQPVEPRRQPIPDHMIPSHPPDLSQRIPKLIPRKREPGVSGIGRGRISKGTSNGSTSVPPPETPVLADPLSAEALSKIEYCEPQRRILSPADHALYLASETHTLITAFIFSVSDSVADTAVSAVAKQQAESPHPTITAVLSLLDRVEGLAEEFPPLENGGSRFGNPAFRPYMSGLETRLPGWLAGLFPSLAAGHGDANADADTDSKQRPATALTELAGYMYGSLGSAARVDYGSGHELHFFIFVLCLQRLSLLEPASATLPRVGLLLLPRYLQLMRTLQARYYLEPAGSHGVWGLDDYHFLPFLVGAAQLQHHAFIRPLAIHNLPTVDGFADDYLYLDMVRALEQTKTVRGLRWHSPMLDDISGVKEGWTKIYAGLKKMCVGEVLGKLVVMQHFLFGGLIRAPARAGSAVASGSVAADDQAVVGGPGADGHDGHGHGHDGHTHEGTGWGDPHCGIRVPSSVGAAGQSAGPRSGVGAGQYMRPLPFD